MGNFIFKELESDKIEQELLNIGFDESYRFAAGDKFRYKIFKIFNLTPAQANILKQTALSLGSDCATHRDVITGNVEFSNAILTGSINQIKKIALKLKNQPFKLCELGKELLGALEQKTRVTKLAGVLNITQDSFSDGGKYFQPKDAQEHLIKLIQDGADIIDIGAESTRPFSNPVSSKEQIARLKPIMDFIMQEKITIPISIDTRSSEVADYCLNKGAAIINDVSGLEYDDKLAKVVSNYNAQIIIQHSKGTPDVMQLSPSYKDVVEEVYFKLKEKRDFANSIGIKNIIIDPGIGFGKTKEHNIEILKRINEFKSLNCPIMVGVSRKRFLGENLENNDIKDALSLAFSYPLIENGIDYLRVHNVKLHKQLLSAVNNTENK